MDQPRPSVIVRWIVAALIGGGGVFLLARVMAHESNWMSVFGKSLFGISAMITGVLLVSPELVRLAVAPISHLIDSVLLPSETVTPPADLKLARFYGQAMRYDEACEEYERILHYHPDHPDAHLEGIRAAALAGNERLAAKFYHHAQRHLRSRETRGLLDAVYAARHQLLGDTDAGADSDDATAGPPALSEVPDEPPSDPK